MVEIKKKIEYVMAAAMLTIITGAAVGLNISADASMAFHVSQKNNAENPEDTTQDSDGDSDSGGQGFIEKGDDEKYTIAIDAGHGGIDPGKVGINDKLEKDINLAIALKLEKLLKNQDIEVIMTRTEDVGLYEEGDSNKKRSDMKKRVTLINESEADLCISIHQNSYTSQNATGAQVFYYSGSENGKKLAETIQKTLIEKVDNNNHRVAKSNNDYYMLINVDCPSVIIECGFLSNWKEATNLADDYYQEQLAAAICEAILSCLSNI